MAKIVPASRPNISLEKAREWCKSVGAEDAEVIVLGVRGYYKMTMGTPGKNDRKIYDDAICVVLKDRVVTFNGNTDPAGWRKGYGKGESTKGMATLVEGLHKFWKLGKHKGKYKALVQTGGPATVRRDASDRVPPKDIIVVDGEKFYLDTGYFGINGHRGAMNGTSSLGCQTIYPPQYDEWINLVEKEMKKAGIAVVQYALVKA